MIFRNWSKLKIGEKVQARKDVPALMEHAIQFNKGEKADVAVLTDKTVGILDKFGDISYFNRDKKTDDYIGDWFK